MRLFLRLTVTLALVVLGYLAVLAFPRPLFAHHLVHGDWEVWSDRPIDPAIGAVLDDAARRLATSELHRPRDRFRVFFCNSPWRLWLFSQHFSTGMGGEADTWLTRNIYIRASDIAANRIHSPGPGPILDAADRPLSYFVAHEATHILESRAFGRLVMVRHPKWLTEGYADYVGKGGDFDLEGNRRLLKADSALLDYGRSGLYRRYHLEVAWLLDRRGLTARQVFAAPLPEAAVLRELRR